MKFALSTALLFCLFLIAAVLYFDQTEKQASHFKTYQELRDSELIAKGWVPSFIPSSSYDIYEKHRVDAAGVNVKFRFARGDTAQIEASCKRQISNASSDMVYICGHGNNIVVVKLSEDGRGEMVGE